jgi:hypothetical protein
MAAAPVLNVPSEAGTFVYNIIASICAAYCDRYAWAQQGFGFGKDNSALCHHW